MTFPEAEALMREGWELRHGGMGPGWCVVFDKPGPQHWFVNPITGSWVGFPLTEEDRARKDWAKLTSKG